MLLLGLGKGRLPRLFRRPLHLARGVRLGLRLALPRIVDLLRQPLVLLDERVHAPLEPLEVRTRAPH